MTTTNATTLENPTREMMRPQRMRRLLTIAGSILALLAVATIALSMWMSYVPADLDVSTTHLTEQGLFAVSYTSDLGTVPVNQMQSWTLHVETAAGQAIENATITVDGDMPQHGHGLPTRPQVTRYLGNGDYLVEGLKFHMPGWWVVDFVVTVDGQSDAVRFNMMLH